MKHFLLSIIKFQKQNLAQLTRNKNHNMHNLYIILYYNKNWCVGIFVIKMYRLLFKYFAIFYSKIFIM